MEVHISRFHNSTNLQNYPTDCEIMEEMAKDCWGRLRKLPKTRNLNSAEQCETEWMRKPWPSDEIMQTFPSFYIFLIFPYIKITYFWSVIVLCAFKDQSQSTCISHRSLITLSVKCCGVPSLPASRHLLDWRIEFVAMCFSSSKPSSHCKVQKINLWNATF